MKQNQANSDDFFDSKFEIDIELTKKDAESINTLDSLRKSGVITDEEFEMKKAAIMNPYIESVKQNNPEKFKDNLLMEERLSSDVKKIPQGNNSDNNNNESASKYINSVIRKCENCNNQETVKNSFKLCGGCKKVFYCGRECQVAHWSASHKNTCQKI